MTMAVTQEIIVSRSRLGALAFRAVSGFPTMHVADHSVLLEVARGGLESHQRHHLVVEVLVALCPLFFFATEWLGAETLNG